MIRKIFISLFFATLAIAPTFAADSAATTPPPLIGGTLLPGADKATEALIQKDAVGWLQNTFLKNLIDTAIGLTAAIAVIFLIIGGYQYLTAVGNEEQIKTAHKTITFSLIGLLLALLAFAIVQIVVNIQFEKEGASGGGAATNYGAIQNDWSGEGGINNEIDAGLQQDKAKEIDKVNANFGSASLFGADVKDILPFAEDGWDKVEAVKNLPTGDFKEEFLPVVARILIYGMAFVAFLVFFFAGAWLIVGWGEESDVKKAKDAIIWAITGLAMSAVSYLLVKGLLEIDLSW